MTQDQDRHSYPNYSLTTSMYFAEVIFRLVCWGEQIYRAISRIDTDQLRQRVKTFFGN